jgi:unsaturated rhamnogalacturonyl hydrolase
MTCNLSKLIMSAALLLLTSSLAIAQKFKDSAGSEESSRFALSNDGYTYKALNGNEPFCPDVNKDFIKNEPKQLFFSPTNAAVKKEILNAIKKVNNFWQEHHQPEVRAFWDEAAYHTGNMEAFKITGDKKYKSYSEKWAIHNQWMGAKSSERKDWKYSYGESDDYVLFGDWQICFQTYIDLYNLDPAAHKIARVKEVMSYQMSTAKSDYWWWADGLYMVMPVMTKMYKLTGNKLYLDKLYEYFSYANSIMYDQEVGLYYRDAKYVYPKHKSLNGRKDFWARGDGWVFAGLAKVLKDLPKDDAHRAFYVDRYKAMAEAILESQQEEGYWTRSMLDKDHAPDPKPVVLLFLLTAFYGV